MWNSCHFCLPCLRWLLSSTTPTAGSKGRNGSNFKDAPGRPCSLLCFWESRIVLMLKRHGFCYVLFEKVGNGFKILPWLTVSFWGQGESSLPLGVGQGPVEVSYPSLSRLASRCRQVVGYRVPIILLDDRWAATTMDWRPDTKRYYTTTTVIYFSLLILLLLWCFV